MIRRMAFRYSESHYGHWLPLMLADRIGIVEGLLDDLVHLRFPNIAAERGWKAEWRHNRQSLVARILLGVAIVVAVIALIIWLVRR